MTQPITCLLCLCGCQALGKQTVECVVCKAHMRFGPGLHLRRKVGKRDAGPVVNRL